MRGIVIAGAVLALAGCAPGADSALPNDAAAQAALDHFKALRIYFNGQPPAYPCTNWFTIANPVLVDKVVTGKTATVRVNLDLTPNTAIEFGSAIQRCSQTAPQGTWAAGQTSTVQQQYHLEQWDSGWRVSDGTIVY